MYITDEIDWMSFLRNKDVLIYGCGKQGKACMKKLKGYQVKVIGFIDNDSSKWGAMKV